MDTEILSLSEECTKVQAVATVGSSRFIGRTGVAASMYCGGSPNYLCVSSKKNLCFLSEIQPAAIILESGPG